MKTSPNPSRRHFLKSSLAAPVALAAGGTVLQAEETPTVDSISTIPTRKLGRNGPEVSMLNIGSTMAAFSPQFIDIAWRNGIRYIDTADCYKKGKSEKDIAQWLKRYPERRKELFLVNKDHPREGPQQLLTQIDTRLAATGCEYFDLFFLHMIGVREYGKESLEWPRSDEFKEVLEKIKASGKAKLCGFSCHDEHLVEYLNAAADGGFVDAIMLRYDPFHEKGGDLDKALDRCHEKGIGLICMKELRSFSKAPKIAPGLEKANLTTHQAVLHKVWSDHRISSICSAMDNVEHIEENTMAARIYKEPLGTDQIDALKGVLAINQAQMCPGCPSCLEKAKQTDFAFMDVSRYLSYYEQDGDLGARELYRKLSSAQRRKHGIDLSSIRESCQYKVDYPEIIQRAESYFA